MANEKMARMFGKKKSSSGSGDESASSNPPKEPIVSASPPVASTGREGLANAPLPGQRGSGIMSPGLSRRSAPAAPLPTPTSNPNGNEGRKLVVGREISLSGEIKACEKLVVEGKVEADLAGSRYLEIAESGVFRGNASVEVCDISGLFEGDLEVSGCLHLRAGGVVRGQVSYAELECERGGRVIGTLTPFDLPVAEVVPSTSAMPVEKDPEPLDAGEGENTEEAVSMTSGQPRDIQGLVNQDLVSQDQADGPMEEPRS